ncbi:hypothetical protein Tco_0992594 [Tanacetum coccineum]|uniref:Uncharacterized protein n=1 Tax=Tanacetum coccineum TaxID=301880 RepID=A0ABQ5F3V5_9ASTR
MSSSLSLSELKKSSTGLFLLGSQHSSTPRIVTTCIRGGEAAVSGMVSHPFPRVNNLHQSGSLALTSTPAPEIYLRPEREYQQHFVHQSPPEVRVNSILVDYILSSAFSLVRKKSLITPDVGWEFDQELQLVSDSIDAGVVRDSRRQITGAPNSYQ